MLCALDTHFCRARTGAISQQASTSTVFHESADSEEDRESLGAIWDRASDISVNVDRENVCVNAFRKRFPPDVEHVWMWISWGPIEGITMIK